MVDILKNSKIILVFVLDIGLKKEIMFLASTEYFMNNQSQNH